MKLFLKLFDEGIMLNQMLQHADSLVRLRQQLRSRNYKPRDALEFLVTNVLIYNRQHGNRQKTSCSDEGVMLQDIVHFFCQLGRRWPRWRKYWTMPRKITAIPGRALPSRPVAGLASTSCKAIPPCHTQ